MGRCNKQTVQERVELICELRGLGLSDAQIRKHPRILAWGLGDKRNRFYVKLAARVLAERLQRSQDQAAGLADKRFDTIYALALKEKCYSAAIRAAEAGLKLRGLYLSGRGIQTAGKTQRLPSDGVKQSAADRDQRVAQIIEYESRAEESAVELMMNGMPVECFRVPDIQLLLWQLHILLDRYVSDLVELLGMLQKALRMAALGDTARWMAAAQMTVYAYQTNVEGWNEFTRSISVDAAQLLEQHAHWNAIARLCDPIVDRPISRQQLRIDIEAAGIEPPRLESPADLAARWKKAYFNRDEFGSL